MNKEVSNKDKTNLNSNLNSNSNSNSNLNSNLNPDQIGNALNVISQLLNKACKEGSFTLDEAYLAKVHITALQQSFQYILTEDRLEK